MALEGNLLASASRRRSRKWSLRESRSFPVGVVVSEDRSLAFTTDSLQAGENGSLDRPIFPHFSTHRSVGRLVQYPPQIFIPFRGAAAAILFGAFLLARTGPHPGGQLRRLHSHFRDHLLRRIHSQTGHFRESDHRRLDAAS